MQRLKYASYSVTCQEVPNEVSLIINISGCPHKCDGCHSTYLEEYVGEYISEDIDLLISKYDGLITCVCFMGGDQNIKELSELCKTVKSNGLKTCIYSGQDSKEIFDEFVSNIDYLKVGRYIKELGGLSDNTTNQHMYDIKNNKEIFLYGNKRSR